MRRPSRTGEEPVEYEEAFRRVQRYADARGLLASSIASIVWPQHRMKAQGSALAIGPFLRRMVKDGLLTNDYPSGWRVRSLGLYVSPGGTRKE